jgi:hypothetical protein
MFKKLEISVGTLEYAVSHSPYDPIILLDEEDVPLGEMLALLPSLEAVLITFTRGAPVTTGNDRKPVVQWLIDHIPPEQTLLWNFFGWEDAAGEEMVKEKMKARGGVKYGDGLLQMMAARG